MAGSVASITYAPVKGLGAQSVDEVELERSGVRGNRRFHLIADDGRLSTARSPARWSRSSASSDRDGSRR